ncbi:MOP flippase family protein [Bradyrhizobium jicamae]|uniref:MOP flippase family protein n=1 Tax=Bradyrhizobium jicamae TaxID=280332 RepID=A0ABS5FK39_9BRAD|nr:MOP flippase family protein [Bradyrhizobium jicamae]MBR0797152.1 MOP flippase family protein [Bradyrhizobium jicamae]
MTRKSGSAISNFQWAAAAQIGRVGLSLIGITILARILPTSDFGLLAMATIVTNFASIIRDMGTSAAVIQRSELSNELLDTVFWSNVLFGVLLGGIVALTSPLTARAFHEPAIQPLLMYLSLAFPLGSSGAPHLALLERGSRFRSIAIIEIFSTTCGVVTGVVAAMHGAGVVSLVLQTLIGTALSSILFWAVSGWRPTGHWSRAELLGILGFSGNLVGFNIINYFSRNADGMLIGRVLGPVELGVYNIAYRIMLFPLQNLTFVLNRAFLPIFSGQQHNPALIGRNYLRVLQFICVITAPMMFGLWSVREPFVLVVLGEKWRASSPIIGWLAPTGFLQSVVSTTGTVLIATGKTWLMRNLGMVCAVIYVLSFVIGLPNGAVGVARAYFAANLVTSAIYLHYTLAQVDRRLIDVAATLWRPLLAAMIMSALIVATGNLIVPADASAVLKLVCLVPVGAVIYCVLLMVGARDIVAEMRAVILKKA